MAHNEEHQEALAHHLAWTEANIAELQRARQRYRYALAELKEEAHLRRMGGVDWAYEATEVGTGTVVATDRLNAVHRVNHHLPGGIGYSVRVRPQRDQPRREAP